MLEGLRGFAHSRDDWQRLHAQQRRAAYHLEYGVVLAVLTWLEPSPQTQWFVRVFERDECIAVLRLAMTARRLFRIVPLRALEATTYAECRHQDVLLKPGVDARAVWDALTHAMAQRRVRWHALTTIAAPAGGGFDALASAMPARGRIVRGMPGFASANSLNTSRPYAALAANFSPTLTKNLAKGWRRLDRAGPWEVVCARGAPDTLWAFDEFCRVEASGWKGASGTGTAAGLSGPASAYCRDLFLLRDDGCWGEVNLLRLDGRAIAAQLCVVSGGARFVLKIGFDETHRRLGPGQLLLDDALRRACADTAITRLDLVSDQPWHADWGTDHVPVHDYMLLQSRTVARVWQFLSATRELLRRGKRVGRSVNA